ncbi:MAG: outer membrane protein assembly factor BamA [Proteobacteria bacterium]|nr:outer membrane protein assembly factor BamA [Pseudomonadota bacterium]MBU4581873.1 outer membrane protein assembly factor BamA [Pseudomonadota bacterium]MCG2741789.1 outer membrane protein assembly factor BamA [Syntrophaceae bacterium]
MNKKLPFACIATFLIMILLRPIPGTAAENIKLVALFPFEVHSTSLQRAAELQEILYREVVTELQKSKNIRLVERERINAGTEGKRINDALVIEVGKKAGALYAVSGSVSEFGDRISVDARLIDLREEKVLPGVFVQGRGRENLGAILAQLRTDILLRIAAEERIARIEFKGNRKIEASAIQQVLKSAPGNIFTDADLSADIKAIYKMGYFDDVTAEVAEVAEGKAITFVVEEKPMITEILIKGNKAVKRDDIEGAMSVRNRQTVNPEKLKADMEKIKTLYDGKGFYNAEIGYAIEKGGERDIHVVITIVENEKLFIRGISFEGNRAFTTKELKNMMTTNEWGIFHFFTDSGLLKKDQLKQDVGKLNAFYLNNGFINAQIGEPVITYDRDGIRIKIPVSEGKQFRVGKVAISGDELATPRAELLAKLQIRKKDFYDREAIMKDMDALTQACNDEGYAGADVVPRTEAQEKNLTVDVTYEIKKGNLVYFNRINITGNSKTRDKVIRRQLSVVEGDLYNRTKLKKSYMALNQLRYFEEIDFQSEKGPDETLTDVNIRVKEKPTGIFSLGAGYSALDHGVVSAQVSQQNLFGRGQILSLKASLGSRSQLYDISFTEPWLFDMPLWSKFDIWNLYREYDSYNLDSKGFGSTFGYPLWPYVTGYVGYRLSLDNVKDIKDAASYYIKKQAGQTTSSGVTFSLTRDSTNDVMFPSTGSKNSASVEYTGGPLQGDVSYTRYGATSAWFFPLPLDTVIGARGRMGAIRANEGKDVPIFERYYLGGINSLRGLREVGPKDPATGDVIGGLTMLNFNFDYIFPLIKNAGMKGVLFFDTGNTWNTGYHLEDMRKTAGVGIRWYSPIGPLRLEWGYVLDRKEDEAASRWEFSIGMFM